MRFSNCDDRVRIRSRCPSGRPSKLLACELLTFDPPHYGIAEVDIVVEKYIIGAITSSRIEAT